MKNELTRKQRKKVKVYKLDVLIIGAVLCAGYLAYRGLVG